MPKRKVLLVVEGIKQEVQLFKALFRCFELDLEYEIYSYNTNIYDLYERMFLDGDEEDLSLLGVLKERANETDKVLFDQDYSDVLLVFDYDPQDNRFSHARLEEMQAYFNESTDNGKLYINYPMVEACKHFKKLPDEEFFNRSVAIGDIPDYKQIASRESKYQNFERCFTRPDVDAFIAMTAMKAMRVSGIDEGEPFEQSYQKLDHEAVLLSQIDEHNSKGRVWVLGMALLFVMDYSKHLIDTDRVFADSSMRETDDFKWGENGVDCASALME